MAMTTGSPNAVEPVPRLHHQARVATSVAIPLVRRLLGVLWVASLATVVLLALAANLGPKVGLEVFAIRGGSMTPTIPMGAAVIAVSAEPDSIRAGASPRQVTSMDSTIGITTLRRLLGALWLSSLAVVVLLALATNLGPHLGFEVFAVRGGSMMPAIPVGAAIVAVRTAPEEIRVGDIVTIRADNGVAVTHRVVEIDASEADVWLRTKGDANATPDAAPIPITSVVGVVAMTLPVLGYLIAMLTTLAGVLSVLAYALALLLAIWLLEESEVKQDGRPRFAGPADAAHA